MKDCAEVSCCSSDMKGQRGSSTYTFLGFVIVALCVIGAIYVLPGIEFGTGTDPELAAAQKAMAAKDWKQAINLYDKAITKNPANGQALVGRSKAYMQLGELDKALADAKAAVEKQAGSASGYAQKGIVLKLQQQYDEALKDFSKTVKMDSGYPWAYAQIADIYMKQKDYEKALANVNKALSAKPNFVEGIRVKAWILNRMGKCKEASEEFKKVQKLSPKDAWSLQDEAWFLMTCPDEKIQDSAKAMELAKKAADMTEGKDGVVLETLAEAYFRQGDPAKAAELQKKAIDMGSKKCPDGSCVKEMKERLQKYELASRPEVRIYYEILPLESGK